MYYLNEERRVESLNLRNKIIEEVKKELNVDLNFWFNDLYKVKNGVVRRLKGGIYSGKNLNDKEYNDLLDDVSDCILNLNWNGFRVELKKLGSYSFDGCEWKNYCRMKDNGFEGNFLDYKKKIKDEERVIILKIDWDF
jgi:hypothetical protein